MSDNKEFTKEINAVIEKNLPAAAGKLLKKRLEEAESDRLDLSRALDSNKEIVKQLDIAIKKLSEHNELDSRLANIESIEDDVLEKRRNLQVEILTIKLEEANKRADTIQMFVSNLVRNVEFRKSVYGSKNTGGYTDETGRYVSPKTDNDNLTQTDTVQ